MTGAGERFYSGRPSDGVTVRAANKPETRRGLALRLDLASHSPTGFAWGYAGSGAAQLALALLADALGDDARALRLHQDFKARVVMRLPRRWTLTRSRIVAHVRQLEFDATLRVAS